MKTILPLVGLSIITFASTGCAPYHERMAYTPHLNPPNYKSPSHIRSKQPQNDKTPKKNQSTTYQRKALSSQQYNTSQQDDSQVQTRRNILQLAHKALGTKYKYGGASPSKGFDCSGLMQYIHKKGSGINIPRTAAAQRNKSRTVNFNQLQPGDMLFFKTGRRTDHVGVFIGNHQFIHAPNSRSRVQVTSMNDAYWRSKFVKFGTYING